MRISVIKGHPNYVPNGKDYEVTLDGVKQTQCLIADAEKGEVTRYKFNRLGMLCKAGGRFLTETVQGNVVIALVQRV